MNRTNVEFLTQQLEKATKRMNSRYSTFILEFDPNEHQAPKTNMDEIMFYHALPKILEKKLRLEDTANSLVTAFNEIPLWMKLTEDMDEGSYRLFISKRFRKRKVVDEWHGNSDLKPILIQ
ncbi:hypothetical protein [Salmonirosea aquatica]|uniref:Uncharacterized protein n=1 Tax=Salmonirosea aquatica TaxID=2654236 RepID=A0A7C9BBV6_9BACT|nr:hypothetical protein [Cytophagaceae bacterium SJW1-29]